MKLFKVVIFVLFPLFLSAHPDSYLIDLGGALNPSHRILLRNDIIDFETKSNFRTLISTAYAPNCEGFEKQIETYGIDVRIHLNCGTGEYKIVFSQKAQKIFVPATETKIAFEQRILKDRKFELESSNRKEHFYKILRDLFQEYIKSDGKTKFNLEAPDQIKEYHAMNVVDIPLDDIQYKSEINEIVKRTYTTPNNQHFVIDSRVSEVWLTPRDDNTKRSLNEYNIAEGTLLGYRLQGVAFRLWLQKLRIGGKESIKFMGYRRWKTKTTLDDISEIGVSKKNEGLTKGLYANRIDDDNYTCLDIYQEKEIEKSVYEANIIDGINKGHELNSKAVLNGVVIGEYDIQSSDCGDTRIGNKVLNERASLEELIQNTVHLKKDNWNNDVKSFAEDLTKNIQNNIYVQVPNDVAQDGSNSRVEYEQMGLHMIDRLTAFAQETELKGNGRKIFVIAKKVDYCMTAGDMSKFGKEVSEKVSGFDKSKMLLVICPYHIDLHDKIVVSSTGRLFKESNHALIPFDTYVGQYETEAQEGGELPRKNFYELFNNFYTNVPKPLTIFDAYLRIDGTVIYCENKSKEDGRFENVLAYNLYKDKELDAEIQRLRYQENISSSQKLLYQYINDKFGSKREPTSYKADEEYSRTAKIKHIRQRYKDYTAYYIYNRNGNYRIPTHGGAYYFDCKDSYLGCQHAENAFSGNIPDDMWETKDKVLTYLEAGALATSLVGADIMFDVTALFYAEMTDQNSIPYAISVAVPFSLAVVKSTGADKRLIKLATKTLKPLVNLGYGGKATIQLMFGASVSHTAINALDRAIREQLVENPKFVQKVIGLSNEESKLLFEQLSGNELFVNSIVKKPELVDAWVVLSKQESVLQVNRSLMYEMKDFLELNNKKTLEDVRLVQGELEDYLKKKNITTPKQKNIENFIRFYDAKMYDATAFKNEFDLDLPQWVWDGLPNRQIKIKMTTEESAYIDKYDVLEFNPRIWSIEEHTPYTRKSVLTHEVGHAYHYHKKIITNHYVTDIVEKSFLECQEILKKTPFWEPGVTPDSEFIRKLEQIYIGKGYDETKVNYMIATVADLTKATSMGKYAWGHPPSYWEENPKYKYMELYAHALQVYKMGNPLMKEEFSELYEHLLKLVTILK